MRAVSKVCRSFPHRAKGRGRFSSGALFWCLQTMKAAVNAGMLIEKDPELMTRNLPRTLSPAGLRVADATDRAALANNFVQVRAASLGLASPLSVEDQCAQSMADASPTKWHLAHTTWFFETVILLPHTSCEPCDASFQRLFNSY